MTMQCALCIVNSEHWTAPVYTYTVCFRPKSKPKLEKVQNLDKKKLSVSIKTHACIQRPRIQPKNMHSKILNGALRFHICVQCSISMNSDNSQNRTNLFTTNCPYHDYYGYYCYYVMWQRIENIIYVWFKKKRYRSVLEQCAFEMFDIIIAACFGIEQRNIYFRINKRQNKR